MVTKKAQEMSVGTLVVIVLALIVLVVLALGFGMGWSNLWSKISGYSSPVNVDITKQACSYSCTTQSKYDYCCNVRELKFDKNTPSIKVTCGSDSRIKPSDCSMICNVDTDCGTSEICVNSDAFKSTTGCTSPAVLATGKKFYKNNTIIPSDAICCEAPAA